MGLMDSYLELGQSVVEGKLDLLCPEVAVRRHRGGDVILQGMGAIRSDSDGRLSIRVLAPPGILHEVLRPPRNAPPGQVDHEHRVVVIDATDEQQRQWSSHPLTMEIRPGFSDNIIRFRQRVEHLSYRTDRPHAEESTCSVYFPHQERLSFTDTTRTVSDVQGTQVHWESALDHHRRSISGMDVEFRDIGEGWLRVHAKSAQPIVPTWPGVLSHAIEFAAYRRARPALCVREWKDRHDLAMFSGPFPREHGLMPYPVHPDENPSKNLWLLVERFADFCYSEQFSKGLDVSRMLGELEGIRRGAVGSFGTACLTVCVGIEALTEVLLAEEAVRVPSNDEVRNLEQHIAAWSGEESLRRRAAGIAGQIRQVRAADRLKAWMERCDVDARLLKQWRELRNSSAHGQGGDATQERVDLYHASCELLYRLVAHTVGYTGNLINTSHPTWGVTDSFLLQAMGHDTPKSP